MFARHSDQNSLDKPYRQLLHIAPQNAIGPRRRSTFLRGIVVVTERIVLVSGRKVECSFLEAVEHLYDID